MLATAVTTGKKMFVKTSLPPFTDARDCVFESPHHKFAWLLFSFE